MSAAAEGAAVHATLDSEPSRDRDEAAGAPDGDTGTPVAVAGATQEDADGTSDSDSGRHDDLVIVQSCPKRQRIADRRNRTNSKPLQHPRHKHSFAVWQSEDGVTISCGNTQFRDPLMSLSLIQA